MDGIQPRPSQWAIDRLGDRVAKELWHRIPQALAVTVERARDAHDASGMSTNHAFGNTRWPTQYEELANSLLEVEGAIPVRPAHAFYDLVVVGGHLVIPLCYADNPILRMRNVTSGRAIGLTVQELLANFGPPVRHEQLVLWTKDDEEEKAAAAEITGALAQLEPRPRSLIVGYACNAQQGLLRVCWGDAALAKDGTLQWHHDEDLPLPRHIPRPRDAEP